MVKQSKSYIYIYCSSYFLPITYDLTWPQKFGSATVCGNKNPTNVGIMSFQKFDH